MSVITHQIPSLIIRPLSAADSLQELTTLLHSAYRQLANLGLNYMAVNQSVAVTAERVAQGLCLIASEDTRLRGTILFRNPQQTHGCGWYDRPEVASIAQFAVDPTLQAQGLGRQLLQAAEAQARLSGATELALDTAEPATRLVNWYTRLGYRFTEHVQWSHTNYRSVILSKALV
ncbi:GNAT family N-acetyltransferase [Erwinia sp. Leaf53]|uniref:GNAT family N-acetyltransferase n=1 Tax=Erwinia sp. Leaf53 TaxID=1736225 RepID=UPI0006F55FFB|nr:GNAT family N-acetyltransferase [Erwinia sp. Leaf53]KQN55657.1 acetyltransferase [Erwinia sp. Leaf53]